MDGMTANWALMGIAACGLLVVGLLAALLLVHGQHLQALLFAQCRHNAMQRDCLQRLQRNDQELRNAVRAERAHVAQLQRKVELLQALLGDAGEPPGRRISTGRSG
jgi:cell division protein FtsL